MLTALIWKETSFDPAANLLHSDMSKAAINIQCGTYYLDSCIKVKGGDFTAVLNRFGGKADYADNIVAAAACLAGNPTNPQPCPDAIHSFV